MHQAWLPPIQGQEAARAAVAPNVPGPITRNYATKVVLELEVREQLGSIADGVEYALWTYGERAPGPFLRVREGDLVEVHLHNHPDNHLAHDVQFDAAIGPAGTTEAEFAAPGRTAVFAFRALRPGLFLYQSRAETPGFALANGLFGLILVEPRAGMPPVDRELQIVQSEYYIQGRFGERGRQAFSTEKAMLERPDYVVFNGRVGSLTGSNALQAHTGERIRVYFGNAGPNLSSSFQVIGEAFDPMSTGRASEVAASGPNLVPPGGTLKVELMFDTAGQYRVQDRSAFRIQRGALGIISASGIDDTVIFSGRLANEAYSPGTHLRQAPNEANENLGEKTFHEVCAACHQASGLGLPGVIPPLANSDFLREDEQRAIRILLKGARGPVTVSGQSYSGEMPNLHLTDTQIANVLTYVRARFLSEQSPTRIEVVQQLRAKENLSEPFEMGKTSPHLAGLTNNKRDGRLQGTDERTRNRN